MDLKSRLTKIDFAGKRVLVRADFNVPLIDGVNIGTLKLERIKPTLNYIKKNGGKIILCTHIGRPTQPNPALSTKILLPWFIEQKYAIDFESDLSIAYKKSFENHDQIILLENLRFFPGEKKGDEDLAKQLAKLADYYVNDAFGLLDKKDCSIFAVPLLFNPERRMFGFLIEDELKHARYLREPAHPFLLIVGGKKIADKMPLIHGLLEKIDTLFLGPSLVFTFLKALGVSVGSSLIDDSMLDRCKALAQDLIRLKKKLIIPNDFLISNNSAAPFEGPFILKNYNQLIAGDYGITIGPATLDQISPIIYNSKTIFYNGLMGDLQFRQTLSGVKGIFEQMAASNGYSVVGGGDSTTAVEILKLSDGINYLSTGGGALIAFMSGQALPALAILENN